jgi:uncharacterized membrane protein (Fun14 family)
MKKLLVNICLPIFSLLLISNKCLAQNNLIGEISPLWNAVKPGVSEFGFSGLLGWAVGFLFKKVFKILAIVLASFFVILQYLSFKGYIGGIDWQVIQFDFLEFFNENFFNGLWKMISHNLPFAGGFTTGLLIGLKKG